MVDVPGARTRLPARYAEWVRDDVDGRWYPLRLVWGGWLLLFTAFNVLLHVTGELTAPWFLAVFVAGASVVAMLAVRTRSAPLMAVVLVAPLVHLRVRRELAGPGPAPALLDVLGLVGGREVLVDPPVVPAAPVPSS